MQIALDVEGVLADTHAAAAERSDILTQENCPPHHYDFPTDEAYDEYMHVSQNLWHNHNHLIPPVSEGISEASRRLSAEHEVDIVTSRTGVDEQVQEWLDGYNVAYDEFVVTDDPRADKTEYGEWDVHIDDSPNVVADAVGDDRAVFIVDRPYNRDMSRMPRTVRVQNLEGATSRVLNEEYEI